jgi:conjugative transfer signal peptidase TraF
MRKRAVPILAAAVSGLALIGFSTFANPAPRLVWNVSASAPIGLYRVVFGEARRGDLVLARPPQEIAELAVERGYLPLGVPFVKRIAALHGDDVCTFKEAVIVNGQFVARRLERDGAGRLLPCWYGCRELGSDELFLLMDAVPDSLDSRYFGPVSSANVIGRLVPLWTE